MGRHYHFNLSKAIAEFYALSLKNDYIKMAAVTKNIAYTTHTDYGNLEITINLSKPEKDPKAIAAERQVSSICYPKCLLCMENEGYQGRINYPARANHRIIRFALDEEEWGFQYSPYTYFNERAIFLNTQHTPMRISEKTFKQLLDIVEMFPGYFVGSNADLPVVGGSILSHNHYQGGRHTFPMEKATIECIFKFKGYEDIQAEILNWPMSVIRISGQIKERLVILAEKILLAWQNYSDLEMDIIATTGGTVHHTITPIARKRGTYFELDLVLRDNHTSKEHPDGGYIIRMPMFNISKKKILGLLR